MTRASWLALGIALIPTRSSAQSLNLERAIRVEGESPGCVTAQALRERIGSYLGTGSRPRDLEVAIDLGLKPARFRVQLADAVVAERRFDRLPAACMERRDAIALAVAVAIEHALPPRPAAARPAPPPGAAAGSAAASGGARVAAAPVEPEVPEPEPESEPEPNPSEPEPEAAANPTRASDLSEPEPSNASGDAPARSARWQVFGGGAYLLEVATTPLVAFTLGAEFAPLSILRIHVAGFATPNAEQRFATGRVTSRAAGGHALACLYSRLATTIAQACAGAGAGLVHAEGADYDISLDDDMAWLAGIARIAVELPADSRLAGRVALDVRANLLRPELRVSGDSGDASQDIKVFGASVGGEIVLRLD